MCDPQLLSVPNPFLIKYSRLRVLEPIDTPINVLYERLLDGTYDKPFIIEDGHLRYLHFGFAYIQSVMRIDQPETLGLRYTQKMMSFLLFQKSPRSIVILGLGGGSLAKFCYRVLPEPTIAVIEIDPDVIALRRHFVIPEDDDRFRVIYGDAAEFVAQTSDTIDVLLVDAFDVRGLARSLANREFLLHAHARLGKAGIMVMNFAGDKSSYVDLIKEANEVFGCQTILVPVNDDGNHVLFAFKQPLFKPNWRRLKQRARELEANIGLDFPEFLQQLERAAAKT